MEVQSRLDPWYVTGLVEGEGCFCVSFVIRPKMRVGVQALPSFSLSLNEKDRDLLGALQAYFECGGIRESRSDRTFKYEVRSVPELTERILPHFNAHPLLGAKRRSSEGLAQVCEMMWQGHHLGPEGMAEIVRIAYEMNLGKRRHPVSTLLRTLSEVKG
jgi:LAGLIDADG DNA endonuclease family protein